MVGKPWSVTLAVFAAAIIAGCGESTAPRSTLAIDLVVTGIDGPDLTEAASGVASIECRIGLRATATGSGSARWVGATVRYFAGVSGEPPIDSVRLATVDVQSSWGSATIAPDSVRSSQWTFNAPYPFSASIEYLYEPADTKRLETISARFDCGPVVTSDAAMPSILALQVCPSEERSSPAARSM